MSIKFNAALLVVPLVNFAHLLRVQVLEPQKLVIGYHELPLQAGYLCLAVNHEHHLLLPDIHHTVQRILGILDVQNGETIVRD